MLTTPGETKASDDKRQRPIHEELETLCRVEAALEIRLSELLERVKPLVSAATPTREKGTNETKGPGGSPMAIMIREVRTKLEDLVCNIEKAMRLLEL